MNQSISIKLSVIFLILIFGNASYAQFTDHFSDGDFTNSPSWDGSNSLFTIVGEELNSNSPGANTYYLSTPSALAAEAQWEFYINLKFSTSGANFVDVYLMSDNSDLTNSQNGYFVRIGNTADEISLYKLISGSESVIIDGTDGLVNSSSNNPFKIKVSRNSTDLWLLEIDDGATGTYTTEGSVSDSDINSSTHFGILIEQSTAEGPKKNHFFDDFVVSAFVPDNQAPTINSITAVSNNSIDVDFSELLDQATAETITNYSVGGGIGQPTSSVLDGSDNSIVHLTFSNSLTNNSQYQLTVQNVEDLNGNAVTTINQSFQVIIPETAETGDLLINEIMADPNPVVGLPEVEYVEIYNASWKYIDLSDYTLSGSVLTNDQYIISPGQFVILCDDSNESEFQSFGDVVGVVSWNTLTNGGEIITLKDEVSGLIIDEVTYSINWYQDESKDDGGYSLELINVNSYCSGLLNWAASIHAQGGTPGTQNSLYSATPDIQPPTLLSVNLLNSAQLEAEFDETIDPSSIGVANFTLSPSIGINQVNVLNNNSIVIDLVDELVEGSNYSLIVEGLADCSGNIIESPGISIEFEIPETADFKDLIINEIMADPTETVGLPESEFVEIYNNSNKNIDLKGYLLNNKEITNSVNLILPGDYLILCPEDNAQLFSSYGNVVGMKSWDGLNNGGETITLTSGTKEVIDNVIYAKYWYKSADKSEGGWTLELIDPDNLCSDEENWTASVQMDGGTPGRINSVDASKPDLSGPTLEELKIPTPDSLYLIFNERLDTLSVKAAAYAFEPLIEISRISLDETQKIVKIALQTPLDSKTLYSITVNSISDCSGNFISGSNTLNFRLPETPLPGDIIINEILVNPRSGSPKFVEVYNNSNKYINLEGWLLAKESDIIESIRLISSEFKLFEPGDLLAFTTDLFALANEYPFSDQEQYFLINSIPNYAISEGVVVLIQPDSIIHDKFEYSQKMHHPLLNDDDGVSLERISYDAPTNDPSNWHSASSKVMASPGSINSQSKQNQNAVSGSVEITPKVFLPDNSGTDDFATINYHFEQPGFVANVTVVDNIGKKVYRIAENELLSSSGFFIWNGTHQDGRKAKVGAYIVYFEVVHTNGTVKKFRERVVVGSDW